MKLVSVVVQAYNSADTIVSTLDSIKNQTYKNIELIITDDKSKDNTIDISSKWVEKNRDRFTDVKFVTAKTNTGIPGSNNRALKQVRGEYAEFLAADDCMFPNAIERYVEFCEVNPDIIPISRLELFSDDKDCDFASVESYCNRCYEFAKKSQKEQYRMLLIQNVIAAPAAAFYPVHILHELKGFDEAYRMMEDYPINLKLMHRGYCFGFIDEILIRYRISGGSITGSGMTKLKETEMHLFFREKMWYMIQNGMGIEALKQSKSWIKVLAAAVFHAKVDGTAQK